MNRTLARVIGLVLLIAAWPLYAAPQAEQIVHMLDYIGVDYAGAVNAEGKILADAEFSEMREFAGQVAGQIKALPQRPQSSAMLSDADSLKARIEAKAPPAEVAQRAAELRLEVVAAYAVVVAPKQAPDMSEVGAQYQHLCAGCHGAQGHGDGVAGKSLEPPPADFHDAARMHQRSVYGLYNTISLGVAGTSMTAFDTLPENERWALAFYVAALGADPAQVAAGEAQWKQGAAHDIFQGLREVTTLDAGEARTRGGDTGAAVYAYLVAHPEAIAAVKSSPIQISKQLLQQSVAAYARGDHETARRLAVSSYLEGFELAEASLDSLDPKLRVEVETAMIALRSAMRQDASVEQVTQRAQTADALLDRADELLSGQGLSPSAAALSSFIILVREGLEAILVLAAVLAFLVKAERRDALRYVHMGWIAALTLGVFTWFAASYLFSISGASRELTEGVTALIAAAVLLYVGFWMHSKAYAQAWQRYVRERLSGALSTGTVWALALLSFLAVYREVFEVVLFYQALWTQAGTEGGPAVLAGFFAGAVVLVLLSWAIFRYGIRLPLGLFFGASSWLMALLAVVFVGKGIAALQEAGHIAVDAVSFPRIATLGVFPTAQSLLAQGALVLLIGIGFVWTYRSAQRQAARV